MGFSTQKFFPEHQPKAALSQPLWHEKTASRKFFDLTKVASENPPAKPTSTRKKSDRTYETAPEVIYEHYRYTAFGEPEIYDSSGNKLATSAIKNEILWNSRRYDSTTNLYYYKYRHYAPALGRWLSRDPIEEWGGVNLYGFVGNEPLGQWDRLGLELTKVVNYEEKEGEVIQQYGEGDAMTKSNWRPAQPEIQLLNKGKCKLVIKGKLTISIVYKDKALKDKKLNELDPKVTGPYANITLQQFERTRAEQWKTQWNAASDETKPLEKVYDSIAEAEAARTRANQIINAHLYIATARNEAIGVVTYGHYFDDPQGEIEETRKLLFEGIALLELANGK
jgi:RHS repeat-associated protein